jgi:hypothetical protein
MCELYSEDFQPWIIFQQDGAPPHWGSHVHRFLDATFPNRWTGKDGPTTWPLRSPDITLLDFYLWGYVKDKVFSTPVPDIINMKARITDAFVIRERLYAHPIHHFHNASRLEDFVDYSAFPEELNSAHLFIIKL